jgi:hypothetical protein
MAALWCYPGHKESFDEVSWVSQYVRNVKWPKGDPKNLGKFLFLHSKNDRNCSFLHQNSAHLPQNKRLSKIIRELCAFGLVYLLTGRSRYSDMQNMQEPPIKDCANIPYFCKWPNCREKAMSSRGAFSAVVNSLRLV